MNPSPAGKPNAAEGDGTLTVSEVKDALDQVWVLSSAALRKPISGESAGHCLGKGPTQVGPTQVVQKTMGLQSEVMRVDVIHKVNSDYL